MNPAEMRSKLRNYARTQLDTDRSWFRIENHGSLGSKIYLYDEIGFFGVSADDMITQLNDATDPVSLYINSPGGEIFEGIALYNALLRRDVAVFIDGIAASAASFVAQAASPGKLGIAKTARVMIHNGQAFAGGDAGSLRKMAEILDKETANIASIYSDRTGKPSDHWLEMMDKETWLSADEACQEGLVDFVYDPRNGPSNILSRKPKNTYKAPPRTYDDFRVSDDRGWVVRNGQWVFDPDGDGDDDSTPEGDTDHDYFNPDGSKKKDIPPKPDRSPTARLWNAKYKQEDRDRMASSGEAMEDGSYPIADGEDVHNAVHAVGRGTAHSHNEIRKHVIKRAKALGESSQIPDDWNSDGSLKTSADDLGAAMLQLLERNK